MQEREQPKAKRRRVLCPIALDDAWKDCDWPGKLRTQIEDLYVIPFHELGFDEGYARLKMGLPTTPVRSRNSRIGPARSMYHHERLK